MFSSRASKRNRRRWWGITTLLQRVGAMAVCSPGGTGALVVVAKSWDSVAFYGRVGSSGRKICDALFLC